MMRRVTDPRFCLNRSVRLRGEHSAKLKQGLAHFFEIIEEYLTPDNLPTLKHLKTLLESYQITPWFFYGVNKTLQDIIESDDTKHLNNFFAQLTQAKVSRETLDFDLQDLQSMPPFFRGLIIEDIQHEAPEPLDLKKSEPEDLEKTKQLLTQACNKLKHYDPEAFGEVTTFLPQIMTYACPETVSSSSFNLFGLGVTHNAASAQTVMDYIFFYVHEAAHTFLFTLACDDALVLNDFSERFSSPIRHDPRPMEGIFHAFFVAARFMLVLPNLNIQDWGNPSEIKRFEELGAKLQRIYSESKKLIQNHGKLTPLAQELFVNTCSTVDPLTQDIPSCAA